MWMWLSQGRKDKKGLMNTRDLMPSVSILIPVYNRANRFEACLSSALNQTYSNCKILIYDDGSDNKNFEQIQGIIEGKSLVEKQRIIFEYGEHRGVGYARNYLLSHFGTIYACWLDSDDMMHSKRVEKQLKALKEQTVDIVFCSISLFKHRSGDCKRIIEADVSKYSDYKSLEYNATSATGFFSRKVKICRFNSNLTLGGEDILWIYQLIRRGMKIGYLKEFLYLYRNHGDRIGRKKRLKENSNCVRLEKIMIDKTVTRLNKIQNDVKLFKDYSIRIEDDELAVIEKFIPSIGVVFDVGANLGQWTINVLERKPKCTFHLFEPSNILFEKMRSNLKDEINDKKIIINQCAILDCEKTKPFYFYPHYPGNSSFYRIIESEVPPCNLGAPKVSDISAISLDIYCEQKEVFQIDFLKIDTEGSEWEVIKGAKRLISEGRIDFIQFEYGACYRKAGATIEEIYYYLTKNKYDVFKILPERLKYIRKFLRKYENYTWCNYLAVNRRLRSG